MGNLCCRKDKDFEGEGWVGECQNNGRENPIAVVNLFVDEKKFGIFNIKS